MILVLLRMLFVMVTRFNMERGCGIVVTITHNWLDPGTSGVMVMGSGQMNLLFVEVRYNIMCLYCNCTNT